MAGTEKYPQAPALTDAELEEFLQETDVARLATHNPDGTIHLAPGYFAYEAPDILLGTQMISRKVRNIQRDPDVTVLFDVVRPVPIGAVVYGTAELDRSDVVAKRAEIFRRYMPEDDAGGFAQMLAELWEGVVIRVRPRHIVTFDYRKGFPPP